MITVNKINENITIGILDLDLFLTKRNQKLTKRETEKEGALFLLNYMLKSNITEINYTLKNKPYLKNRKEYISISHSNKKLAIIINTKENTGIDIEQIKEKVLRIKHKFLNKNELKFAGDDPEKLITYWASKETLFKVSSQQPLNFILNLFVDDFYDTAFTGLIIKNNFYKKHYLIKEKIDDYILVYILK